MKPLEIFRKKYNAYNKKGQTLQANRPEINISVLLLICCMALNKLRNMSESIYSSIIRDINIYLVVLYEEIK